MDWRIEAIDKLKCYRVKKASVKGLEEEIQELEAELASIRKAPTSKAQEGEILDNLAQQEALKRSLQLVTQWLKRVRQGLVTLSEEDRRLLQVFFMQKGKGGLDQLCQELGVDKDELHARRDRALRYFTLALYGITEI